MDTCLVASKLLCQVGKVQLNVQIFKCHTVSGDAGHCQQKCFDREQPFLLDQISY